ncbi:Hypothetical protein D9617_20g028340 [Elsinoe fawcettii]|nr:Hypothetical protein D9617_20g028340 [Elsinoe fawcettii]
MESGRVILYDIYGEQIHDTLVDDASHIISLEWVEGPTPTAIREFDMMPRRLKHESVIMTESGEELENFPPRERAAPFEDKDLPVSEKRRSSGAVAALTMPETRASREEIGETLDRDIAGTVVRSPPPSSQPARIQVGGGREFADFFSPERNGSNDIPARLHAHSPMRSPSRPRISSNTFVQRQAGHDIPSEHFSQDTTSSLASEPAELDPNLTLSYLNAPTATDRTLHGGLAKAKPILVTPDYMITSSSDYSFLSDRNRPNPPRPRPKHRSPQRKPAIDTRQTAHVDVQRHAHPSPAKPKRRSQQRPSFTAYMNRTAASTLRRRSHAKVISGPVEARVHYSTTLSTDSQIDEDSQWLTSGSETEKVTSTLPTTQPPTRTIEMASLSDHLANVPRKDSSKKPAPGIINAATIYHDAPTYPQTRKAGDLLESLRRDRPKTTIKAFPYSSFMPADPAKMPIPPPGRSPPARPAESPKILITPPAPERKGSRRLSRVKIASKKNESKAPRTLAPQASLPLKVDNTQTPADYFYYASKKKDTPYLPGNFPMSTTSEEAYTASEWQEGDLVDGHGQFCPPSGTIRQLCPRGSSLSPGTILDISVSQSAGPSHGQKQTMKHIPPGLAGSPISKFNPACQAMDDHTHLPGEFDSSGTTAEERRHPMQKEVQKDLPPQGKGETNWAALGNGMTMHDRRKYSKIKHTSDAKKDPSIVTSLNSKQDQAPPIQPPRKSKFTEGQIDGLTEAIVDAIKRASQVDVVTPSEQRQQASKHSTAEDAVNWTSMSSGLTPSPLRIIRYYEETSSLDDSGYLQPQARTPQPLSKKSHTERVERHWQLRPQNLTQDKSRTSLQGTEQQHRRVGAAGGEHDPDKTCQCCDTLRQEISDLREEIVALRADLTGRSITTANMIDRNASERGVKRGNDLYSFSETR